MTTTTTREISLATALRRALQAAKPYSERQHLQRCCEQRAIHASGVAMGLNKGAMKLYRMSSAGSQPTRGAEHADTYRMAYVLGAEALVAQSERYWKAARALFAMVHTLQG